MAAEEDTWTLQNTPYLDVFKTSLELHITCGDTVLKNKFWLQMGLISLEFYDMLGMTDRNDFVVYFFCWNFFK